MHSTRRRFLQTCAAASLADAGCSHLPPKASLPSATVGSQLYGWGQYYQRAGKRISDHYAEVLSAVRDCGYAYAETSLDLAHPENSAQFAELARSKGLGVTCFYTGPALHGSDASANVARVAAAARLVKPYGTQVINCNPAPIGREKSDLELRTQAAALTELGKALRKIGLELGVHNHTPEMKNNAREFRHNFDETPADAVGFCFDVHWVYRGGMPPLHALLDYGDRVVSWHLRQSREAIWWEDLDSGDVDYGALAILTRNNPRPLRLTVELALEGSTRITRSVVENHRRSRDYVRKIYGA